MSARAAVASRESSSRRAMEVDEVRRVIYTTNAIEALNRQPRKAIKTKGSFPNEDAARKLIYLALRNAVPQWTRTRNWTTALLAFVQGVIPAIVGVAFLASASHRCGGPGLQLSADRSIRILFGVDVDVVSAGLLSDRGDQRLRCFPATAVPNRRGAE